MWLSAFTHNKTLLLVLTQILTLLLYRSGTMDEKKGLTFTIFTCFVYIPCFSHTDFTIFLTTIG